MEVISLARHATMEKDPIETIKQRRPTEFTHSDTTGQVQSASKIGIVLGGLLVICVGAFIWTQVSSITPSPSTSRPTPTKFVETQTPEPEAPAVFNVDISTTPNEAAVMLNGVSLGVTPITLELPKNKTGEPAVNKEGFQDYPLTWPTTDTPINVELVVKPIKKSLLPKKTF